MRLFSSSIPSFASVAAATSNGAGVEHDVVVLTLSLVSSLAGTSTRRQSISLPKSTACVFSALQKGSTRSRWSLVRPSLPASLFSPIPAILANPPIPPPPRPLPSSPPPLLPSFLSRSLSYAAPTLSLLLPGSLTPSALLLTASQLFHTQKSPKADEYIRSIGRGPELLRAVEECVEAGGREWGVEGEGRELLKVRFR